MKTSDQPTPGLRERVAELMGTHKVERDAPSPFKRGSWNADARGTVVTDFKGRYYFSGNADGGASFVTYQPGFEHIPDYPGDLNHAHAACRALLVTEKLWVEWSSHLTLIVGAHRMSIAEATRRLYTATPEEICTALLRTLGGEEGV